MSDTQQFSFTLEQQEDFAFLIRFDQDIPPLLSDEPPPLGKDAGPNPSRLLAASVANCLSASLLFALRKFKNNPGPITTVVTAHLDRNEAKRLRVGSVDVMIQVDAPADSLEHLDRVLDQFEDFCVVTQSVRSGFPVNVSVRDAAGKVLKG
ncbi:OsmC family protein [Sulfuritalea sp.]|mgnify:FL=1|uniref:OsmC family protein n=1 Tax=Sulfuritalea sp. TaxID=2480090 RepID=UPI00286E92CF|nr:OsmC family protein [Sulfuritalea sp.]